MKDQVKTMLAMLVAGLLIVGAMMLPGKVPNENSKLANGRNVSVVDGKQIIKIIAKGGYNPAVSNARADMPTVLRVETGGTFDCSSALVIPAIGYRANLSPSGVTDVELPPQKKDTTLRGLCAMGMYNFSINFN